PATRTYTLSLHDALPISGHRRADIEDMVSAHLFAVEKAPSIGFGRYIVSATTPFTPDDLQELRGNAPAVVKRYVPEFEAEYARRSEEHTSELQSPDHLVC